MEKDLKIKALEQEMDVETVQKDKYLRAGR